MMNQYGSVIIWINGYSNIAGAIAGQLFKAQYAPSYDFPLKVTMILMAVGMVGFGAIRSVYMWENKRGMDRIATWDESQIRAAER